MSWLANPSSRLLPLVLAVLGGLALAAGLRRQGEQMGRAAADLEQQKREQAYAKSQARAAASFRLDGAAERLRRGRF